MARGKSFMVVDDVASCRKISGTQLGRLGYDIMEANQGEEAVKMYGENHAGIQGILMDLMMPVMDGYCAVTEIRAMEQKQAWRRMPIIAVTSLSEEEVKMRSESESFDGYVDKPTSLSKLAQVLEMMRISPPMGAEDVRNIIPKDAVDAAHGTKREGSRLSGERSMSGTDTDSGDVAHAGSNEGSDEQNGRKGSNSDRDPDARSSGDSGNEKGSDYYGMRAGGACTSPGPGAHPGPDNRSKRPVNARDTGDTGDTGVKRTSNDGSNDTSNDGSSDASRQGLDRGPEEKSTMDKADDGAKALTKMSRMPTTSAGTAKTKSAVKVKNEAVNDDAEDQQTKGGDDDKLLADGAHLPCARCGSEKTRFCYYNNGVLSQPRHYCRACQRYWTEGGTLRNLPKGSGRRKDRPAGVKEEADAAMNAAADVLQGAFPSVLDPSSTAAGANAQSGMQRAILTLMTQVVGFDVDRAANTAGLVASRAGEEVASIVLNELGHSSEAIEIAVTLAKTTGWRIGISISAVASAAVAQCMTQQQISSLIATQLPFLASALVREVAEQVKTMQLSRQSRGNDSNDSGASGGSGGTAEDGGNSVSTATRVGGQLIPTLASVQATQHQLMQQWMSELQGLGFTAPSASTGKATKLTGAESQQSFRASHMPAPSTSGTQAVRAAQPQASGTSNASVQGRIPGVHRAGLPVALYPTSASAFARAAVRPSTTLFGGSFSPAVGTAGHPGNPTGWYPGMRFSQVAPQSQPISNDVTPEEIIATMGSDSRTRK